MLNDKRIRVIIGHYGSGKTEFSINYAINLAKSGQKVALADLDIANPYFRSREKSEFLESHGILVLSSYIKGSGIDLPSISADILGPLQNEDYDLIMGLFFCQTFSSSKYHSHYSTPPKISLAFAITASGVGTIPPVLP
jgi:hypothetical protein